MTSQMPSLRLTPPPRALRSQAPLALLSLSQAPQASVFLSQASLLPSQAQVPLSPVSSVLRLPQPLVLQLQPSLTRQPPLVLQS